MNAPGCRGRRSECLGAAETMFWNSASGRLRQEPLDLGRSCRTVVTCCVLFLEWIGVDHPSTHVRFGATNTPKVSFTVVVPQLS